MTADIVLYKADAVPVGIRPGAAHRVRPRSRALLQLPLQHQRADRAADESTEVPKVIGIDGVAKMSKSLNNHIELAATPAETKERVMKMVTDPARLRRTDPGNPDICNVYAMHKIFSSPEEVAMVERECRRRESAACSARACWRRI
jgi:tryptophanyl-tRNA synthetase